MYPFIIYTLTSKKLIIEGLNTFPEACPFPNLPKFGLIEKNFLIALEV